MSVRVAEMKIQGEQAIIDLILEKVRSRGADAQLSFTRKDSWEASVSQGEIDTLSSSVSVRLSLSVFLPDGRSSNVSSNDLRERSILALIDHAIGIAEAVAADPFKGLPPVERCGRAKIEGVDDGGVDFDFEWMLRCLLGAESQARVSDSRVVGVYGCSALSERERTRIVNSLGIDVTNTATDYRIYMGMTAEQSGEKQTGYDFSRSRNFSDLRPASAVAEAAVERALQGFGWKTASSGPVAVVFNNDVASELLSVVGLLADGDSFLSKRSCWMDSLDESVASACVTIKDDPLVRGGIGSRGFDETGVEAKPLTIVEKGVFRSAMTNAISSRKLDMPLTGHAGGTSNLVLQPGRFSQEELLSTMGTGFLVTRVHGKAVDITAGTWSKGASGFWVENGVIAYPVQGVTLAGKLEGIFKGITAVGSDLREDYDVRSPSLLVSRGLTLGGK